MKLLRNLLLVTALLVLFTFSTAYLAAAWVSILLMVLEQLRP